MKRFVAVAATLLSIVVVPDAKASSAHVTLQRASCSVSGPAFTALPVPTASPSENFPAFAEFTTVRTGTWAGIAANGGTGQYAVIRWRAGHAPAVLARYSYPTSDSYPGHSIAVVGITPAGSVVASVQDPHNASRRFGMAWTEAGYAHRLHAPASWTSVAPIGVADSGHIYGSASDATHTYVVDWTNGGAPARIVATLGGHAVVAADQHGDVAWKRDFETSYVQSSAGVRRELAHADPNTFPSLGAGAFLYGTSQRGVVRWDLHSLPASGAVPVETVAGQNGNYSIPTAAGRAGDLVFGLLGRRHLRTDDAAYAVLPPEPVIGVGDRVQSLEAIDSSGRVAFTSAADKRIHFLSCR